jgi:dihydroflavonol-4-reductase
MIGHYKRSKFLAEEVAREFALQGLPVVIVNPAAPVGVADHKPTATGKMILDFLLGKMPAYVDTTLTVVDVEDVAEGHLLAAQQGRVGERYILGGEILSLKQILDILAEVSGCPQVRVRIPSTIAFVWAYVDVALARIIPGYTPMATPEKVRISMRGEPFDSAKAVKELGFPQTPAREALRKAVEWYLANGYTAS